MKKTNIIANSPPTCTTLGTGILEKAIQTNLVTSPPAPRTGIEILTSTLNIRPPCAAEFVVSMGKTLDIETASVTTTSPPTAITCSTREGLVEMTATTQEAAAAATIKQQNEGACLAHNTHGIITVRA